MSASEPPGGNPQWGGPGQASSPPGQWASPPGPPQKKRRGRGCLWGCAGALAAVVVIVIVVLVIASGDKDESTTSAPSTSATAKTRQGQTQEAAGERADLVSFKLEDRSQAGITNIWLVWTIKNNSSEKSNYSWDWEAVDAGGTRLEDGSQLETNVLPGQTARGEFPTTLKTVKGIKLDVTSFDRTAAY